MFKKLFFPLMICCTLLGTAVVHAQADPSSQQIYDAARAGQLGQAQAMIERVLRDHPSSARAHYVAAEVYARSGDFPRARRELSTAQTLSPGLTFVAPGALAELQQQLASGRVAYGTYGAAAASHRSAISWGGVLLIVAIGAVVFALLRRRSVPPTYAQPYGPYPGQPGVPPGANPYGPYPGGAPYGPMGMGAGSGLMGGLATGLAVGAGVAAGEGLVNHMLGSGAAPGSVLPAAEAAEPPQAPNGDMGGNDFGIADGGSSWDSGGGDPFGGGGDAGGGGDLGGGGGGDWS